MFLLNHHIIRNIFFIVLLMNFSVSPLYSQQQSSKTRTIVTTDGEIDDECSMIRCLLYANEWDIEGIITSSSQYHWQGHKWAGDDWMNPYLDAYEKVYPNLIKHDKKYPTPVYLRQRTALGNVKLEGEMDEVTAGSQLIVKVLLDKSDSRPIWLQAWGGTNTIARALKTIEQEHPQRMAEVARKMRFSLFGSRTQLINPTSAHTGANTTSSPLSPTSSGHWPTSGIKFCLLTSNSILKVCG